MVSSMKRMMASSFIEVMTEYELINIDQTVQTIYQVEYIGYDTNGKAKYIVESGAPISEQIEDGE